jgi:hypothetical protein
MERKGDAKRRFLTWVRADRAGGGTVSPGGRCARGRVILVRGHHSFVLLSPLSTVVKLKDQFHELLLDSVLAGRRRDSFAVGCKLLIPGEEKAERSAGVVGLGAVAVSLSSRVSMAMAWSMYWLGHRGFFWRGAATRLGVAEIWRCG